MTAVLRRQPARIAAGRPEGGRVVAAAPDVAIALGYDITAALEEPDGY